jgi:ribosome maturation factor RimP
MDQTTPSPIDFARIRDLLAPVLVAHGVTLVDLEWLTERVGWTLRITIEREGATDAGGGVTLEDCAEVSRDSSATLDVADVIPHAYHLEVSSPGLDRRLKSPAEFKRFVGRTVKVKLRQPAPDGQRVLRGPLEEASEDRVAVNVDGKRIEASIEDVTEARLVFELTPQPKAPKGTKGARQGTGSTSKGSAGASPSGASSPRKRK